MTTRVSDSFTDTDSTSLDAHTPDIGGSWVEENGQWDIQSNRANTTGSAPGGNNWLASIDSGISDGVVSCVINLGANDEGGVLVRFTDTNHFWLIVIHESNNDFRLMENNAGWTERDKVVLSNIAAGTDYTIEITLNGATISATLDGGNQISYSLATFNQTATKHGLYGNPAAIKYDDFSVSDLVPGRVTHIVSESLSQPTAIPGRITQAMAESLAQSSAIDGRVTVAGIEVANAPTIVPTRFTHLGLEVLIGTMVTPAPGGAAGSEIEADIFGWPKLSDSW